MRPDQEEKLLALMAASQVDFTGNPAAAFTAHDLPSVGALVRYLHAAAGFPVKSTWLAAIKAGNLSTWPGLTYAHASRYCPNCEENSKGHLTQAKQGIRSTKTGPTTHPTPPTGGKTHPKSNRELHLWVKPISTLYTDNTGRFPVRSRSRNQYLMVAYHCDTNAILVKPFQTQEDCHRIPAYTRIMIRLKTCGHIIDHQVLDNEASKEYFRHVTNIWTATYQMVPPDVHRRNIAERAIRTFKAHFLSILAGIPSSFPN